MVSSDMGHPEEIEEDRAADNVEPAQRPGGAAGSGWGDVAGSGTRERGRLWLGSKAGKRPRGLLQFPHGAKVQRRRGL